MRARVSGAISGLPASARETVDTETPANRATSAICTRWRLPSSVVVAGQVGSSGELFHARPASLPR